MPKRKRKRKSLNQQESSKNFQISTLCWCCANATNDGCSWSAHFIPVKGWEATPTIIKEGTHTYTSVKDGQMEVTERNQQSYNVHSCPQFIEDCKPNGLGMMRSTTKSNKDKSVI